MSASKWLVNQQIFPGPVSITFINRCTLFVLVNLSDASMSYKTVKQFHMFIQFQGLILSGEKQHKLSGILICENCVVLFGLYLHLLSNFSSDSQDN